MAEFPFLDLPSEIQQLVVCCATKNSFQDLHRLKSTCNSMCALADTPPVYSSFDLYKHPWWTGLRNTLLSRSYNVGNPSTLYIKGVEYFFGLQRHKEGLALMKRAADAGYERVLYTYAMTRKLYWEDDECFARFTRESVGTIGRLVRNDDVSWAQVVNEGLITKKFVFMSTDRPLFYNCPCPPMLDVDWDLWHMELSKTKDMCSCQRGWSFPPGFSLLDEFSGLRHLAVIIICCNALPH